MPLGWGCRGHNRGHANVGAQCADGEGEQRKRCAHAQLGAHAVADRLSHSLWRCAVTVSSDTITPSAPVYRWAAQDGPLKGLYRIFLYKIQPNQFHTVLLYNRGAKPLVPLYSQAAILGGPTALRGLTLTGGLIKRPRRRPGGQYSSRMSRYMYSGPYSAGKLSG
jgi:hypothetical protein